MNSKITVGLDWFSCTFPASETFGVARMLGELFGEGEVEAKPHRYRSHRVSFARDGVTIGFNDGGDGEPVGEWAILELSGAALSLLRPESLQWLLARLVAFNVSCTRLDVRADDYAKRISPIELWAVYVEPRNFSGFKHRNFVAGGCEVDGSGVYLGRRGKLSSGVQVVYYDKAAESAGGQDCYRWEVRFAKEKAHAAFHRIMRVDPAELDTIGPENYAPPSVEEMASAMGELVGGAVDFFEPGQDATHLDRRQRAAFWVEVRECLRRRESEGPAG